jgi:Chlamydia polymorphic membrane protein (Chlamydia_PMP).
MNQLTVKHKLLISTILILMLINTPHAAEFVVQTDLDLSGGTVIAEISPDVYTIQTLRSAVEQANDEINFPGPDIIRFDENITTVNPGSNTTIILGLIGDQFDYQTQSSPSALGIDSTITIQGTLPGAPEPDITLEALGLRHFQVNNGGRLRLYDLTLSDGETPLNSSGRGGAVVVDNNGKLQVKNSTFFMNVAVNGGALAFQSGALDALIENSQFLFNDASDNNPGTSSLGLGGAIFVDSGSQTITIENSSFSQNYADAHGGAIYTDQSIVIKNTTFNYNDADNNGGALYVLTQGNAAISNSVFFENQAINRGGAIYAISSASDSVFMVNSTLAKNAAGLNVSLRGVQTAGGAIYSSVDNNLLLHNNIAADNHDGGMDDDISADLVETSSHNLIGVNSGSLFGVIDQDNGNLVGTVAEPIEARLGLNQLLTAVIGLEPDSPAVNSGSDAQAIAVGLIYDIDGNNRIIGSAVDRGAFETDIIFFNGFE